MVTICDLTLYGTGACHLCEQARELVQPWLARGYSLTECDVSGSDELFERYGLIIPVLRVNATGEELNWPFGEAEVARLLAEPVPPPGRD